MKHVKIFFPLRIVLMLLVLFAPVALSQTAIPIKAVKPKAPASLNYGLMAYYPFNGNANDASGNGNNGTLHGGVAPTTDHNGKRNSAYYFNGVDGYISVPDSPSLNPYDQLTISFWVKTDKNDYWYPIIYKGGTQGGCDPGANREYASWIQPWWWYAGIELNAFGSAYCWFYTNTSPVTTGRWYFFAGVVDLQNHVMNLYLDGALQTTVPDPNDVIWPNSYELRIGQSDEGFPLFNGAVDEIRLYNRALSSTEIQQLYAMSMGAVTTNILQRLNVSGVDRMTTTDPSTEACTPDWCPSEGQMFYVPAEPEPGTIPLYRLYNGGLDHMDATNPNVPGYWSEGPLGFPWRTGSLPGLKPMFEGFESTSGDHALQFPYEQLRGYVPSPLHAFGYPGYLNKTESILSLSGGGVTVESNRVYGGLLKRWTWKKKQFLNDLYPWQGSYSIMFINGWTNQITETADDCGNDAPIISAENKDTTQITLAVPLANPFAFGNDSPCVHPVVWKDTQLGKKLTLNFNGMGPVAQYTSVVWLPSSVYADFFHPISAFKGEFNRYWTYDAETTDLQEVGIPDTCEGSYGFSPNFGGIILSDQSGDYALGIYGVNVSQGGSVSGLGLLRHVCDDGTFSRMDVVRSGDIPAGYSTYNVYIMTGTVDQVRVYMNSLFNSGVK